MHALSFFSVYSIVKKGMRPIVVGFLYSFETKM